jgi:hypothetical protein
MRQLPTGPSGRKPSGRSSPPEESCGSPGHHSTPAPLAADNDTLPSLSWSQVIWPGRVFAPLVDVGLSARAGPYPQFDLIYASQSLGLKFFQVGNVTADQNGEPIFAGYRVGSPWDRGLRMQIAALRQLGGDVAIVFGGANGAETELARVIADVDELTKTYQWVVDAYGAKRVNFDIQGSAADATASILGRWQAVATLQHVQAAEGRPLDVWLTFAALPDGLMSAELNLVRSAIAAGVEIAGVNIMAANFGDAAAPDPDGCMADYAIQAVRQSCAQLRDVFAADRITLTDAQMWAKLGITPMIGQNDTQSERFYSCDAERVLSFAEEHGLGMIAIDSINRDANTGTANYDSTGIGQAPYEFTKIFAPYTQNADAAK